MSGAGAGGNKERLVGYKLSVISSTEFETLKYKIELVVDNSVMCN